MRPPPKEPLLPKKSKKIFVFSDKEILDSARPLPPLSGKLQKKAVFFLCLPLGCEIFFYFWCLLHFRYHSLSDVDKDEDWLFAKTTYCRVACKRSHHQTVVGSPVYLYYLHASYLKLLIGKETGFSIVFNYKYKLEFIFGIFHFWLVYKQIFWPRHDAGLNFLPCKLIHHILRNAIVILLMLVVNILT